MLNIYVRDMGHVQYPCKFLIHVGLPDRDLLSFRPSKVGLDAGAPNPRVAR